MFLLNLPVEKAESQSVSLAFPPSDTPNSTAELTELVKQGSTFYQAGQFTQAIAVWQQAASRSQTSGDKLNHALILSYLALAYQQLGQWSGANRAMQSAIALLDTDQPHRQAASDRLRIRAQVLNTQGSLQFAQGQVETALATWQQAARIYAQVGTELQKVGNLLNQVQAQQALGLFLRARQTLNSLGQQLQQQPDSPLKAMGLRSLGNGFMMMGRNTEAYRSLQQSLVIAEQIASPTDQSATLLSLGNVARAQRNQSAAIAFYQQAVQRNASPSIQLQADLNQLSLLIEMNRIAEAQALITTIQAQIDRLPASRVTVQARINFAASLMKLRDKPTKLAAQILATAVQQAGSLRDRPSESQALGHLGNIYEQTQQWSEAKNSQNRH